MGRSYANARSGNNVSHLIREVMHVAMPRGAYADAFLMSHRMIKNLRQKTSSAWLAGLRFVSVPKAQTA